MARSPIPPLQPRTTTVEGLQVFDRHAEPEASDADAIVHLHGFGVSGTYLEPTAARLAARYRTFVPDLPGTGRSQRPKPVLDIPRAVEAVVGYCDAVGLDEATFVANSLGCVTTIELAVAHPERVTSLVMVSPAGGPNNQPLPRALRQMMVDGTREPFSMFRTAIRDYLRFGVLQSLSLFAALTRHPTLDRLELLETPTLVIIGERDPLVDSNRVRTLFSARPAVALVEVPGAHALNYSDPVLVAGLVSAFLEGTDLTAPAGPNGAGRVIFDNR